MEKKEIKPRSDCPVSFCMDNFGDKWTLLIMRDMILDGKSTFGEFLNSKEGIATNILTDRLKMLESEGFILKYPISGKARTGYCPTEKGITLIPIIIEISLWGAAQGYTGQREEFGKQLKKDKPGVMKKLAADLKKRYNAAQKEAAL